MKWLSMLKNNAGTIGKVVALVGALSAFATYSAWLYDLGEKSAHAQIQAEQTRKANENRKSVEKQIAEALKVQADDYDSALERVRNEREIVIKTEEVVKYVDRIKTIPAECDSLAADIVGVLQQHASIIRAAAGSSDADTE